MARFKGFYAAALVLAIALLSLGSSSANAAPTVLCKVEESPCPKASKWENRSFEASAAGADFLMGMSGTIECKSSILKGTLGAANEPQVVAIEGFTFSECKRGMETCKVKVAKLGGLNLLRTGPNSGEATLASTEITTECGLAIDCKFEGSPVSELFGKNAVNNASFRFLEVALTKVGGAACPATKLTSWYGILTPLPVYIQSP